MNAWTCARARAALSILGFAALGGCASPPPERFYRLPSPATVSSTSTTRSTAMQIAIGPVSLPEIVDRPQLVTGRASAPAEVQLWETHRWAEPLRQGIGRALAARLALALAPAEVTAWPATRSGEPTLRIDLQVLRWDAEFGRGVDDELLWVVRRAADGQQLTGRSVVREASTAGRGHEALVEAHALALDGVARDLAGAVTELAGLAPVLRSDQNGRPP